MSNYRAESASYQLKLPTNPGFQPPGGGVQAAIEILGIAPQPRHVVISVALVSATGATFQYGRIGAGAATFQPLPCALIARTANVLGGIANQGQGGGAGQGAGRAHIVGPDIPIYLTLPPDARLFAVGRSSTGLPAGTTLFLSITAAPVVEALSEEGHTSESQAIIDGIRRALIDVANVVMPNAGERLSALLTRKR